MQLTYRVFVMTSRLLSQLDEQLHAGIYFYFFTARTDIMSSNMYIYPLVVTIVGYAIINLFYYFTLGVKSTAYFETWMYSVCVYASSFLLFVYPRFSMNEETVCQDYNSDITYSV